MSALRSATACLLLSIVLLLPLVYSQEPEVTQDVPPGFLGRDTVRFNHDKVMVPWYNFFKSFFSSAQPRTFADFVRQFDIKSTSDFNMDLLRRWPEWQHYVIGWFVLALFGVLLLLVVPLVGVLFCCCRTCGLCGGGKKGPRTNGDKCKLVGCGTALFIVTTILTVAAAFLFVAARGLSYEVTTGILDSTIVGFRKIESFKNDSLDGADVFVYDNSSRIVENINNGVEFIPEYMVVRLGNSTEAGPALASLQYFGDRTSGFRDELEEMETQKTRLHGQRGALDAELSTRRASIADLLDQCAARPLCSEARQDLPNLAPHASYGHLSDTNTVVNALTAAISAGIVDEIRSVVGSFANITENIRPETEQVIKEVQDEITNLYSQVRNQYANFTNLVRPFSFSEIIRNMNNVRPPMRLAGFITNASLCGLGVFMLLICAFWYAGLLSGALCRPREEKERCYSCNKGQGANLLMAGTGINFIWYFVFATITIAFFFGGGVTYANSCRHIMPWDDTMQAVERIAMNSPFWNNTNIDTKKLFSQCKRNQALYSAMDFDKNGFNITKLLDLSEYGIDDVIARVQNISVDIGTVTITTPALNSTILALAEEIGTINMEDYRAELEKGITYQDLDEYADRLRDIAAGDVDESLANQLRAEAANLDAAHRTHIVPMDSNRAELSRAVVFAGDVINQSRLHAVPSELSRGQELLNTRGNELLREAAGDTGRNAVIGVQSELNVIDTAFRYDLMQCGKMYGAAEELVYMGCEYALNPVMGVGIFAGIFVFFSLLGMIFATHVAGYLRRYQPSSNVAPTYMESGVYTLSTTETFSVVPSLPMTSLPMTAQPIGGVVGYTSLDQALPDQLIIKDEFPVRPNSPPPAYTATARPLSSGSRNKVHPEGSGTQKTRGSKTNKIVPASELPDNIPLEPSQYTDTISDKLNGNSDDDSMDNANNQLREDSVNNVNNQLKKDSVDNVNNQLKEDSVDNVNNQLKEDSVDNVNNQLKEDSVDNVNNQLKEDSVDNVSNQLKEDSVDNVNYQLKEDSVNNVNNQLKNDKVDKVPVGGDNVNDQPKEDRANTDVKEDSFYTELKEDSLNVKSEKQNSNSKLKKDNL